MGQLQSYGLVRDSIIWKALSHLRLAIAARGELGLVSLATSGNRSAGWFVASDPLRYSDR